MSRRSKAWAALMMFIGLMLVGCGAPGGFEREAVTDKGNVVDCVYWSSGLSCDHGKEDREEMLRILKKLEAEIDAE